MADCGVLRLLIVDDDLAMGGLVRQVIIAQGLPEPRVVMSGAEALAVADSVDVILLDQQLPDVTGIEGLGALRARAGRPSVTGQLGKSGKLGVSLVIIGVPGAASSLPARRLSGGKWASLYPRRAG